MDHTKQPLPDTPKDDAVDNPLVSSAASLQQATPDRELPEEDETDDATIQNLADDIRMCYHHQTELYDTYFYKVVLGGNLPVVRRVVECLESNNDVKVLSWLFVTGCTQHRRMYTPIKEKVRLRFTQWAVIIITSILSTILHPIFYCIHGLTTSLLEDKKRHLSNKIRLPLAYAAFSQSVEMVEYFFRKNIQITFTDLKENNVFHYIADLSSDSSDKACAAFDVVLTALNGDDNGIKLLLFENQNAHGLTPLEYVARFGSPGLLTKMMSLRDVLVTSPFTVTSSCVTLTQPVEKQQQRTTSDLEVKVDSETLNVKASLLKEMKAHMNENEGESTLNSITSQGSCKGATTRVDYVDVTKYESPHITKRSLLLRLIGSRHLGEISVKDLRLFQKCPVIGKWISMKVAESNKYIVVFHALDVIVTILLLVLLAYLKGSTPYQLQESQNFFRAHLGEVVARQDNESMILKHEALYRTLLATIRDKQLEWSVKCLDDKTLDRIINQGGLGNAPQNTREYNITDLRQQVQSPVQQVSTDYQKIPDYGYGLPWDIKERVIDTAFKNATESHEKTVLKNLFQLTVVFSRQLLVTYPDLPLIELKAGNIEMLEQSVVDFFHQFSTKIGGRNATPSNVFTDDEWRSLFCPSTVNLTVDDFLKHVTIPPPEKHSADICRWQSLVIMGHDSCQPDTPKQVYETLDRLLRHSTENVKAEQILVAIMLLFAVSYIAIDIFEHLRFFYMCIRANHSGPGMIRSVLTWQIPGSYYRKQLNVITYYVLILHVSVQADAVAMYFSNAVLSKATHQMLLIGLCLRFIMHIHSLRLFPWIGHFVTTTFRMATNLIHFSTVLGLVIFIFGIIFHILIVDEECPIRKMSGFESVGHSMFSVFKLTFSHGEFAPYYTSTAVMFTYALFTIICGLLLLNLIIAIMGATAMDLMTPEGKDALKKLEWLNESLSAEYTVTALAGSFHKEWLYSDHRKAGYVVDQTGKTPKVYIRVFYCPQLD